MATTRVSIEDELYDIGKLMLALEALVPQVELENAQAHTLEAHVTSARAELRAALGALAAPRRAPAPQPAV